MDPTKKHPIGTGFVTPLIISNTPRSSSVSSSCCWASSCSLCSEPTSGNILYRWLQCRKPLKLFTKVSTKKIVLNFTPNLTRKQYGSHYSLPGWCNIFVVLVFFFYSFYLFTENKFYQLIYFYQFFVLTFVNALSVRLCKILRSMIDSRKTLKLSCKRKVIEKLLYKRDKTPFFYHIGIQRYLTIRYKVGIWIHIQLFKKRQFCFLSWLFFLLFF